MLALDLEPDLTEKARANKQVGGQQKGWSNLTKAEQVHVRSKIAKAAAVSTGNVTKVKQLLESIVPEIREARSIPTYKNHLQSQIIPDSSWTE